MLDARTLTVRIACASQQVADFVADARNLPRWAPAFCQSVRSDGSNWIVQTLQGPIGLRFVARNEFGVLDHYVSPAPGVEIHVPMRVIPNGAGSEVLFTLFRQPGMSEQDFERDAAMVESDLSTLKQTLEAGNP
jgi:hypothetical protein